MSTLDYILNKYNLPGKEILIEIPNVTRLDLIRWIRELDFKIGAEIGVDRGEYAKLLCTSNPQLKLYGVDAWTKYPEYGEYINQEEMSKIAVECKSRMRHFINHKTFVIVDKLSMDAVKDFEDESLDFVYIDANHEAPYVHQDIEEWAKKVKKDGIVSGHDYIKVKTIPYAVKEAVNEYCQKNNYQLFILGSLEKKPKEMRDWTRSWMFIKK